MMYTCDICATSQFQWPPRLPVCSCKTLNRCGACHFKQLSAPGKHGLCDVCNTERCEVGVLSAMPFTSQLYPWARALHTDAVTAERCPTLLFAPQCFDALTLSSRYFTGVAIGCVTFMASTDRLFSPQYIAALTVLAIQSVWDALSLAVYAAPDQDRQWARHSWLHFTFFQWLHAVCMAIWVCTTPESKALLLCLFLASRFPGWCVDAALIVRMRQYLASQLKADANVEVLGPRAEIPP